MSHGNDQPPDHGPPVQERQLSHGMIAELFGRHHSSFERLLLALASDLKAYIHQEIHTMSDTFHTDLAANTAAMADLSTEVTDGLAANTAAIQALKDQIAAGNPVTAADLATLEGNTAAASAAAATLRAALNPAAPPAPAP